MRITNKVLVLLAVFRLSVNMALSLNASENSSEIQENLVEDAIELAALEAIYIEANGPDWVRTWPDLDLWPTEITEDGVGTWEGITITGGDITQIDLGGYGLTGTLSSKIGDLTQLLKLDLSSNYYLEFPEGFPDWVMNLTNLTSLNFYYTLIESEIPSDFFTQLPNLVYLNFGRARISGSIPESIDEAANLESIFLYENNMSGTIPASLGNLQRLIYFYGYSNKFSGNVPDELINASGLLRFLVNDNDLTGIPNFKDHPRVGSLQISVADNLLLFESIEANLTGPGEHPYSSFTYTPQKDQLIDEAKTIAYDEGGVLEVPALDMGQYASLEWQKQLEDESWETIHTGDVGDFSLVVEGASPDLQGDYRYKATHEWIEGMELTSETVTVYMSSSITFYAINDGDWHDAAIWSLSKNGAPDGRLPDSDDHVKIEGYEVMLDQFAECAGVHIHVETPETSLTVGSSGDLKVYGEVLVDGNVKSADKVLHVSGGGQIECVQ